MNVHARYRDPAEDVGVAGTPSRVPDIPVQSLISSTKFEEAKIFYRSFVNASWVFEDSREVVFRHNGACYASLVDATHSKEQDVASSKTVSNIFRFDSKMRILMLIGRSI